MAEVKKTKKNDGREAKQGAAQGVALRPLQHRDLGISMLELMNGGLPALSKMECNYGAYGEMSLAKPEVEAFVDMFLTCLSILDWNNGLRGSVVIVTQADGGEPELSLTAGIRWRMPSGEVVSPGRANTMTIAIARKELENKRKQGARPNGVIRHNSINIPTTVVMRTDIGQLAVSFTGLKCSGGTAAHYAVFGAMTQILACLRPDDEMLQASCEDIAKELKRMDANRALGVMGLIKRTFKDGTSAIVKNWAKWYCQNT